MARRKRAPAERYVSPERAELLASAEEWLVANGLPVRFAEYLANWAELREMGVDPFPEKHNRERASEDAQSPHATKGPIP
jgi:hypothetical protein